MNPANTKKFDYEELNWSSEKYSIDNLLVDFRLPVLVKVTRGSIGPNCYDELERGKVGWFSVSCAIVI